eukprot:TRINITY_DN1469_c0_g1_i1.p1 TRINITY_DN1469_c0_g1~~TRINITY_DN1469_c0_g1_i1.p1  ORF type:complete len:1791 (-),score=193.28 TRINITY_DN1469_c0_g1_i1:948-6320(-)
MFQYRHGTTFGCTVFHLLSIIFYYIRSNMYRKQWMIHTIMGESGEQKLFVRVYRHWREYNIFAQQKARSYKLNQMNRPTEKRTYTHTPTKPYTKDTIPPAEPQSMHGAAQKQRKYEKITQHEDTIYSLANRVSRLGSQLREQESVDYTYEQSFREAQRRAEDFYEQQIQSLENDKINLIKRQADLNLPNTQSQSSLGRTGQNHSREGRTRRQSPRTLQDLRGTPATSSSQDLQKRLEKAENFAGLISSNLKGDIAYQREQNDKLRAELAENEKEKEHLVSDTTTQEDVVHRYKLEMDSLREKLRICEDDLNDLQEKHASCVTDLQRLTEDAEELVRRERAGEEDKDNLKDSLDRIVSERNELIFRMNDLTEKYEMYVHEMTREREDISKANKNHTKLLTASLLFAHLLKRKNQRLGVGLENMKKMARYREKLGRRVAELAKWQEGYKQKLAGIAFRRWRHEELSWTKERKINEALIEREWDKKQRAKFFSQWQRNFRETSDKRDTQSEAARRIIELKAIQQEKGMRKAFGNWLKFSMLKARRDMYMKKLLLKLLKKYEEDAFLKWLAMTKQKDEETKAQELADSVAQERFKRQMFARLRHNLYLQEDSKVADAQVLLESKHGEKQKNRFLKACTILFMNMKRKKEATVKEEAFESLKFNVLSEKKDHTSEELNKELPEVAALENALKDEAEEYKSERKQAIIKAALLVFRRKMRYYFERWQNTIPVYLRTAAKIKKIFKRWQANKLATGFHIWYAKLHKQRTEELHIELHSFQENVSSLDEAIKELDQAINQQQSHWKNYTLSKLKRIAHMISRRFMHNRILQWQESTITLRRIERGGKILARTLRRHSLSTTLDKYRANTELSKKEEGNRNKIASIRLLTDRNTLRKAFTGFRAMVKRTKFVKNKLRKLLKNKERNKVRKRLARWREKIHLITRETARVENEQLAESNEDTRKEIEANEVEQKRLGDEIVSLENYEHVRGVAAIVKNWQIWENRRELEALKRWRSNVSRSRRLKTLLIRYVKKKEHNCYRMALSNWKTASYLTHIRSINEELKARIGKYDTFTRLSTLKLGEATEDLKQLRDTYNEVRNQHSMDERKIEMVTSILDRLQRFYIKFKYNHNFFLAWADMVHREKVLQGRAKAITTMYVGKHIYAKLKQVAQQSKAGVETDQKWTRAARLIAQSWMRKGLTGLKSATKALREEQNQAELQNQQLELEAAHNDLENIRVRSYTTHEREIFRRRTLKVLWAWQRQSSFQRLLKRKTAQLTDALRLIKLSGSFGRWRGDVEYIEEDKENMVKATDHYNHGTLKRVLAKWRLVHERAVRLPKVLGKLARRQQMHNIGHTLERLTVKGKEQDQKESQQKATASQQLHGALGKVLSTTLAGALARLLENTEMKRLDQELLRRTLLKGLMRKLAASFGHWRSKAEEHKLVDDVESRGRSAEAVAEMSRRHDSMKKLLSEAKLEDVHKAASMFRLRPIKMGEESAVWESSRPKIKSQPESLGVSPIAGRVSPQEIRSPVMGQPPEERKEPSREVSFSLGESRLSWFPERRRRLEERENVMRKLILQWMRRVKGRELVGKYVDFWRKWLQTRKNLERASEFVLKRLLYGEKSWAFDKLKNLRRAGLKTFERIPRTELVRQQQKIQTKKHRIVNSGINVAELEDEAKDLGVRIDQTKEKNEMLSEKFVIGKKLVAGVIREWMNKPVRKFFARWKLTSEKEKIEDLEKTLSEKLASLRRLEEIHDSLEGQNNNLLAENEDLRQTSIDGLEIASVILFCLFGMNQHVCRLYKG